MKRKPKMPATPLDRYLARQEADERRRKEFATERELDRRYAMAGRLMAGLLSNHMLATMSRSAAVDIVSNYTQVLAAELKTGAKRK